MKKCTYLLAAIVCCVNFAHGSDDDSKARELGYPDASSYRGTRASLHSEFEEAKDRRDDAARDQGYCDRKAYSGTWKSLDADAEEKRADAEEKTASNNSGGCVVI